MPLPQDNAEWRPDVLVHADGAVANDGRTAVGYTLTSLDHEVILEESFTLETEYPNHIAEYLAVLKAVSIAIQNGYSNPVIYTDSQGIIDHLFHGANPRHEMAHRIADKLIGVLQTEVDQWMLEWIPREKNTRAHELANSAVSRDKPERELVAA